MANYWCISTSTSNSWNLGTNWSLTDGGEAAGDYPKSGDTAYIKTGKAIAINLHVWISKIMLQGGIISHGPNCNIVFDDVSGAGMFVNASNAGGYLSSGTRAQPAIFSSASVVPANPYTIAIENIKGIDSRTLDFDYVRCDGMAPTLGTSSANRVVFNLAGGSAWLSNVSPLFREQSIIEHQIDGRSCSRVYIRGGKAGVVTITGYVEWASYYHEYLQELIDRQERMYLMTKYVQIPRCRVTGRISAPTRAGQTIVPFSLMLIEDR